MLETLGPFTLKARQDPGGKEVVLRKLDFEQFLEHNYTDPNVISDPNYETLMRA